MNIEQILTIAWTALNTPAGITVMAGLILWVINRIYAAKPGWATYEGAIISAVKFAEKAVPDDSPNKGLARLDAALKYVVKVYEQVNGKRASAKTVAHLKEGVQIVHNELEAVGTIR